MVMLTWGIHQSLADFRWLAEDLRRHPTRMYELVPLQLILYGYHDAYGYVRGGALLPRPIVVPHTPQLQTSADTTSLEPVEAHPIVWQAHFLADIIFHLVSWGIPECQVTNSEI